MNFNLDEIGVEKIDILKQMEVLNERMRAIAVEGMAEEKIKAYDCGVKNTMAVLESLIGKEDKLLYQKHGEEFCDIARYIRLSDAISEIGGGAVVDK